MKTKEQTLKEEIEEILKAYWERINNIEKRIEELARKGADYSEETHKRKSLIINVKRLKKQELK